MESDYFIYRSVSSKIQEIFITTTGKPDLTVQKQAETFYLKIRKVMAQDNAAIFKERILGTTTAVTAIQEIRNQILEGCADPVAPSLLVGRPGICGEYFGIQVHLVAGVESLFASMPNKPNWPWISMVCDVCRDDLLFEIEALAIKEA